MLNNTSITRSAENLLSNMVENTEVSGDGSGDNQNETIKKLSHASHLNQ